MTVKLALHEVAKEYANGDGIHHINLTVNAGEILTILGPSGCGKSTLLRTIGGFEKVTAGRQIRSIAFLSSILQPSA